ncbi:nuclease [Chryseobacterium formosense]|uniref:Nuclease n=1 Tax=Chryseobacterium formosense TaxID=236814 RepID=A0A085Z4W7_9FLAO|nr:lamin tail domain-containing protein [Chryseobacterium formosense]KFE99480.1 nuclease [Chryseobacterium formosense]SFT81662.1 hypothetical protein SAMN05421857_3464 [Chryseobacterium formosense]
MKKIFTVLGVVAVAAFANAQIVINEVYGGGGAGTSVYINDFVELTNLGTTTATLNGATLQYASASGTFNSYTTLPNITLTPGQKYLIEMVPSTANTTGASLPTADYQVTSNISFSNGNTYNGGFNMAAGAGKVALANNATQVSGPTGSNVVDFVGYGSTASQSEGGAPTASPSATTSVSRISGDTNNNSADFAVGAPTPQNSTSATLAVSDLNKTKSNFVRNTFVKNDEITFGADAKDVKVYTLSGQLVKTASVKANGTLNVADLAEGNYIVTGTVNNQAVSQKILKN